MLIRDQADWPLPAAPSPSRRRLRVWRLAEGTVVAVITERGDGTSVTNVAEPVYAAMVAEYKGAMVRVFEHYPEAGSDWPEHFDEIIRLVDGRLSWRRVSQAEMVELVGSDVVLGPQRRRRERHPRPVTPAPPAGPGLAPGTSIHGDAPGRLVTVLAEDGQVLGLLPHWKRHAAEFSWGYHGSGPAELARCILIAVLGAEAACPACAGTGYLAYDEAADREVPADLDDADQAVFRCGDCDAGFTVTPALYQRFKDEVIAGLPDQEWTLSVTGIRSWLTTYGRLR